MREVRPGFEDEWEDFSCSLRDHLTGFGDSLDVKAMRVLASSPRHRSVVLVPGRYAVAHRLMWGVPWSDLAAALGSPPGAGGWMRRGSHRVPADRVNSWTVSLESLLRPQRQFVAPADGESVPGPLGGYAVLASAPIGGRGRRRFWLNPDEVYGATGNLGFAHEREVASVGPVGAVSLSYERQSARGARTWDEIMDGLVERAARMGPAYDEGVAALARPPARGL